MTECPENRSIFDRLHRIRADLVASDDNFEVEVASIRGVDTRIWKQAPPTLRNVVERMAEFADRTHLVYESERLTYRDHYAQVACLANALVNDMGVTPGERVGLAMRNYPEFSVVFWAAVSIGAIAVPLNAWWSGRELAFALEDSGARVLFADAERLVALESVDKPASCCHLLSVRCEHPAAIPFESVTGSSDNVLRLPAVDIHPDDPATIIYTSGTTGHPKGALGTHRNACSTIWTTLFAQAVSRRMSDLPPPDPNLQKAAIVPAPLFHVIGCMSALAVQSYAGNKLVLMRRWDADEALDIVERERITHMTGVPTMMWQLIEAAGRKSRDLHSLERLTYGAAPAPPELLTRIKRAFPNVTVMTGYGMTETSSPSTQGFGHTFECRPSSVGMAPPVCGVRIVDDEANDRQTGESGELWVKGPNVVPCYWRRPDESAETFVHGWVRTGDVGVLDEDGFVYIVDRLKDVVIRGGENVYCVEVENAIFEFGDIVEAAVVGLPHPALGEEVAAVIQIRKGAVVDEDSLLAFLGQRLAGFKVPSLLDIGSRELPRNATGKVMKASLREALVEHGRQPPAQ